VAHNTVKISAVSGLACRNNVRCSSSVTTADDPRLWRWGFRRPATGFVGIIRRRTPHRYIIPTWLRKFAR
jgi:hypothetical protein